LKPFFALLFWLAAATWVFGIDSEWEGLQKSGRGKVLRILVEKSLKDNPNNGETLYWRSKVLMAFGKTNEAYEAANAATNLLPQSADAWAHLSAAAGRMAVKAGLLKKMSFAAECRDAGKKALQLDPNNLVALEVMANFYREAPGVLGGDKAKADSIRARQYSIDKEAKTRAEYREASRSGDSRRKDAAIKMAIQSHPKAAWPFVYAAARALDKSEMRPKDAQELAKAAIENDSYNARAHGYLAQAYAVEQKWGEFDAVLIGAQRIMPENLHPHYMAATWLISASTEPRRAEALLKLYIGQEPEAGAPSRESAKYQLALALEQQGDKAGAARQLKELSKLLPKDENIAKALKRLGG
jgi:tetratricopeptide (TPR) repeat protein